MAENNNLIPTEPDWDGTPLSRAEEIMYSIIHTEEWDGEPLSRGEYLLLQIKDVIENNSMLDLKGRVDTIGDLPATGNKKGDTYSVGPADQLNLPEYFWTGTEWQYLGQIVDLSGYLQLSGGTMTGPLVFNLGGKNFEVKTLDNQIYLSSGNTVINIASSYGITAKISSGTITIGDVAYNAFSYTMQNAVTSVWGATTTVSGEQSLTLKAHRSNNQDTNIVTQSSTGTSVATKKALTVTSEDGLTVTNSGAPTTVTSNAQDLTIQANGADALIQAQGGTMDLKATGGKMTLYSAGGQTPGIVMEAWGGPITEMSTNYVSITSPYAAGYVYLQGGTGSSEANVNLSGGSISETAYANVSVTATNGTVSLSSGNNSSWTATGNLDLTATNGQARLQGVTVSITDSNSTLDMTSAGTTISSPNKQVAIASSNTTGGATDTSVVSVSGGTAGIASTEMALIEAPEIHIQESSSAGANKIQINPPGYTGGIKMDANNDGIIVTTPSFDINGVPVYISTTQPTGNIPIGAIGLGW